MLTDAELHAAAITLATNYHKTGPANEAWFSFHESLYGNTHSIKFVSSYGYVEGSVFLHNGLVTRNNFSYTNKFSPEGRLSFAKLWLALSATSEDIWCVPNLADRINAVEVANV